MKSPWLHWKKQAWDVVKSKGLQALNNPHAMTGRICGCRACFCCAALSVYKQANKTVKS